MTAKIVVCQPIDPQVGTELRAMGDVVINEGPEPYSAQDLRDHCRDAHAVMAFMTERIDETFVQACPKLKIVAGALKGYDNIDVDSCSRRGVAVSIVPDLLTEPTAELTIGLMIAVCRNMREAEHHVRSGSFAGWRPRFYGGSINGATVGVVGAGRVGQAILRHLSGFRCAKMYYDTQALDAETEARLEVRRAPLQTLASEADFVVLALPLNAQTQGLVDQAFLSRMKPGAYLINPARGSLVDESAVAAALGSGQLGGYAADVYEMEDWARSGRPAHIHSAVLGSPRSALTPHIGSAVRDVRRAIERSAAESIIAVLSGRAPDTLLNAQALAQESGA